MKTFEYINHNFQYPPKEGIVIAKTSSTDYVLYSFFLIIIVIISSFIVFGVSFTTVTTFSMTPTYQGYERTNTTTDIFYGDLIILQKKTPQIGDVILFKPIETSQLYFHRVIAVSETPGGILYLTKGDNNRYTDKSDIGNTKLDWVPQENVLGVAIFTIHHVGWFVNELFSFNSLMPILGVALILVYYYYLNKEGIKKFIKKMRSKRNKSLQLTFKDRKISLTRTRLKKIGVIGLLIIILVLPLAKELVNGLITNPQIELLQTDGTTLPDFIDLANPHLFDLEHYTFNQQSFDFVNIKIKITSGGFFNSIESVKIRVYSLNETINQQNGNFYYLWTSTYHFTGDKVINGDLIIPYNLYTGTFNTSLVIGYEYTVSHFLTQERISNTQNIIVG